MRKRKDKVGRPEKDGLAGEIAGNEVAAYENINRLYGQERFHASQGHGFAAEQANDLYDKLHGKEVHPGLGDDNAKDGPDRMVNGQWIQSKYYQDGAKAVDACFRDLGKGELRYFAENGEPMVIEVPKDDKIYAAAVERMRQKISNGQVKGVTDPACAENYVKRGNYTYKQVRNIAKAGNIDSLKFDATNGAITAASAFGASAVIAFATSMWNGDKPDIAAKKAAASGLKVGGTTLIVSITSSQLLKAGLNSAMVGGTDAIASALGPKACAVIINAFRSGAPIYGAAAMKSAAKLLRGNAVVAALTVVALSTFDISDIVRGRISSGQLAKNLAANLTTVAGGSAGWIGGAAAGTLVMPGVGTVVGGLVGSAGAGAVANIVTNKLMGIFIKDDADEMLEIVESQVAVAATDYLMSEDEVKSLVSSISKELDGKTLKDMYASKDRDAFVCELIAPHAKKLVGKRPRIEGSYDTEIESGLIEVLKDLAEEAENGDTTEGIAQSDGE